MDFLPKGLKGFAADAATALNRAKQFTEERLGHGGERTELDGYLENLLSRAELMRAWSEKLLATAEAVLQPNPGSRVEDFLLERLAVSGVAAEKRAERLRNLEALGACMVAAGRDLTPGDTYGSALIKCGQTQARVGALEREFATRVERDFIKPLRRFLDEEARALTRERRELEARRLDLDAAKAKYRRARAASQQAQQQQQQQQSLSNLSRPSARNELVRQLDDQAEAELHGARGEFDKQVELVTGLCNRIIQAGEQHAKYLSKFAEAQAEYFNAANGQLDDLLNGRPPGGATSAVNGRNSSATTSATTTTTTGFASLAALSEPPED